VKLEGVELRRIAMPLVAPFRTSFGTELDREVVLVRVVAADAEGWGECVAMSAPRYSSEYVDAAADVLRRFLVPALLALPDPDVYRAERAFARFKGHPMAKAALESAVLDVALRESGTSFGAFLGAVHDTVPAGVSVGIMDSVPELLNAVDGYLDEGYLRIKLKIEPGWDVAPVRAVRERYGAELLLQVDANTRVHAGRRPAARQARSVRPVAHRAAAARARPRGPRVARPAGAHTDLPGRVDHVGRRRRARDQHRRHPDRQHQTRTRRRLPGGPAHPRRLCRARHSGVVRRHARDRHRPGRERRPRRAAQLHPARRHVRLGPLLLHPATSPTRSSSRTATSGFRRAPAWASNPIPTRLTP